MERKETERLLIGLFILTIIFGFLVNFQYRDLPDEIAIFLRFFPIVFIILILISRRRTLSRGGEDADGLKKEMYEKAQKQLKYMVILIGVLLIFTILFPFVFFGDFFVFSPYTLNSILSTIAFLMIFGGLIWSIVIITKTMKKYPDGWKMDPKSDEVKRIRKEVNKKFIPSFILLFLGLLLLFYSILVL